MQSERDWRQGSERELKLQAPPLANTPCQRFKAACASYAGGSLRLLCAPVCRDEGLFKGMHYSGGWICLGSCWQKSAEKTFFSFSGLPEIPVTDVSFDDFAVYPSTFFLDG